MHTHTHTHTALTHTRGTHTHGTHTHTHGTHTHMALTHTHGTHTHTLTHTHTHTHTHGYCRMGNAVSEETSQSAVKEDNNEPRLYQLAKLRPDQLPIVYSPHYNISFWGLQNIHPFDSGKWGKVYQHLIGRYPSCTCVCVTHQISCI